MNLPLKISDREKKIIFIGIIIVLLIIAYRGILWYKDIKLSEKEQIEAKQIALQKQLDKISQEGALRKNLKSASIEIEALERGLLSGEKSPVAAAEVQRRLKAIALSHEIVIKSERALNPVERELYTIVPVEIGFNSSTTKLKEMLYEIKTSPLLLTVSAMKVRVTNMRNPVENFNTLVVNGFIKKAKTPIEEKQEGGSVS